MIAASAKFVGPKGGRGYAYLRDLFVRGPRLEIDEKFLGKDIPCPDCARPLPTKAPPTPPPLDLPDQHRTSGLAILSLALALVGAFTLVGTLAAVVFGWLAF